MGGAQSQTQIRSGTTLLEAELLASHSEGAIVIPLVHWLGGRENPSSRPACESAQRAGSLFLGVE